MLKFTPILLAVLYGYVMARFSAWSTNRRLVADSTKMDDPALNTLLREMAAALDLPKIHVNIYEIEQINGLAAPDGRIYITRGFYEKFREGAITEAELASVVAHELGHVALGHSKRRMVDFSGQNAMRTALAMVISRFIPGLGPLIANMLTSLVAARLSRNDEFEADAYATALLIKSGIGAKGQKSLFSKLDALTKGRGGGTPAWFLSHPKASQRIAAIEENESKWGNPQT